MTSSEALPRSARPADPRLAIRGFLLIDLSARLFIWSTAFALACGLFTRWNAWPECGPIGADMSTAWQWGRALTNWTLLYNLIYVVLLLLLRLPVPTPREGRYSTQAGQPLDRQLVWSALQAVLTKARLEAPFPAFLVFHVCNLPPMCWIVGRIFGPRTKSCPIAEPQVLDPAMVTIGRNVVIGFGATLTGHVQERDAVTLRRTVIEDDVLVGGHSVIPGGVHVRRGAMIGAGAIVMPDTVIGENEFWAGIPAKKLRDLPPVA
ncbi:MAG: hypothetical protein L6Q92_14520 [Phycisphaerae bacterium]|nr:hypothetical protein [Phycisphaerae bacterium]